jgi:hypothetical protein
MAEFRETFIIDPEQVIALVKLVNDKFTLTLSPYDTPEQALRAALRSIGETPNEADNFGELLLALIDALELPIT